MQTMLRCAPTTGAVPGRFPAHYPESYSAFVIFQSSSLVSVPVLGETSAVAKHPTDGIENYYER